MYVLGKYIIYIDVCVSGWQRVVGPWAGSVCTPSMARAGWLAQGRRSPKHGVGSGGSCYTRLAGSRRQDARGRERGSDGWVGWGEGVEGRQGEGRPTVDSTVADSDGLFAPPISVFFACWAVCARFLSTLPVKFKGSFRGWGGND